MKALPKQIILTLGQPVLTHSQNAGFLENFFSMKIKILRTTGSSWKAYQEKLFLLWANQFLLTVKMLHT